MLSNFKAGHRQMPADCIQNLRRRI